MTSRRTVRNRAAWAVPVVTAGVVVAAALAPSAAAADPHPTLPARSAAQLLADLQTSQVQALSGTVVETFRLGLPSLPGSDKNASLNWQSLVTGTHTAHVWLDGPQRQRVAVLGELAESDIVHNGQDVWSYSSADHSLSHSLSAPAHTPAVPEAAPHGKDVASYTPLGAAQALLSAVGPTTQVQVVRTARVAGRPAYTLVVSPKDARSTVTKVLLAIDATYHVPLRVQVFGAGKAPVFEVAFATISYRRPAASVFAFHAPHGSTVVKDGLSGVLGGSSAAGPETSAAPTAPVKKAEPKVIGTGWTSVLELPAGSSPLAGPGSAQGKGAHAAGDLMSRLTTRLPSGDLLLHTALVNAITTPDGRVFVGAVDPVTLERIATGHAG